MKLQIKIKISRDDLKNKNFKINKTEIFETDKKVGTKIILQPKLFEQ